MPNSCFKIFWDFVVLILMTYTITIMPFRVCFVDDTTVGWYWIEIVVQVLFGIDMIISFLSAFHDKDGALITSPGKIALNYCKTWFFIDLLAVLFYYTNF